MNKTEREDLLESVIPMIHRIASDITRRGLVGRDQAIDTQDLVQTGMEAAWIATGKFDPSFGTKFSTYVYSAIYRAMSNEVRKLGGVMTMPQHFMQYVVAAVMRFDAKYVQKHGFPPTKEDLLANDKLRAAIREGAAYAEIGEEYLDEHISDAVEYLEGQTVSFDGFEEDDYNDFIETLPDESEENDPEYQAEFSDFSGKILGALGDLPPREQEVLKLRFGLEWTLRDVAKHLGVSYEMVRKIEKRGLQMLRRMPARFELQDWMY